MRLAIGLSFACLVAVTLLGTACGSSGDDAGGDDDPNAMIIVTPGDATLTVLNGVAVEQGYSAVMRQPDGSERDITAEATFSIAESQVGYFTGTTLVANGAGRGTVTATLSGRQGTALVEVFRRDIRVPDGVLPTAPDLFDAATDDPARDATIVYPSTGSIVPPNLGDFDVHWTDASGSDLFEIAMTTYYADVRVYASGNVASGNWLAFLTSEWSAIAYSEQGVAIDVTVRGITTATPQTSSHALVRVHTSRENIDGGLYYWAASAGTAGTDGIYRHDMSRPGEPAEAFYTRTEAGRCVACHVLSRDGRKMALTYDGGDQSATVIDVATRTPAIAAGQQFWNFATFTPDATQLLVARQGALQLRDPATGVVATTVPTSGWSTHPDIAPDGDRIVYVRPTAVTNDWTFTGGAIVTQTWDGAATFGGEQPLVAATDNNYYPSFSPDGAWVLFNRSTQDAYDDPSAELWVVATDGSVGPIKLSAANVGTNLTNSWARWAPFEGTFGADGEEPIYWLTFSSRRDFGVRLVGLARPQIWMTPFFPGRAAAGMDPTTPAFRLPFQDLGSSNHIAQWTEEVVPVE